MKYTLHSNLSEIPAEAWDRLASASSSDTPFARHAYLSLWWSTFGGGEWADAELVLVSASEGEELIGIAPMFCARHDGRKALLLLGSIEISDYLDLLMRSADAKRFISGLLDFLADSTSLSGLPLDWYNVAERSPTLQVLHDEAGRRGWDYAAEVYRPTPHVPLSGDFEAYLHGLEKKQRHEIRRKLRRASEGPSPAVFQVLTGREALGSTIDEFLDLMAHDDEKARFLGGSMRGHMQSLMRWAAQAGLLWIAFLRVNGAAAAAAFNFDYRNKLWGYNSAVNRDFLELSPGWVLLAHQIQWACEHDRTELDFMRGDEAYKYRFGAIDRHVMRALITPG